MSDTIPTPRADKLMLEQECNYDVPWEEEYIALEREITAKDATIATLQAKVDVADSWGFTFGICKSTDCPEGRMMAGEHKEGSTLAWIFDEWSDGIGDKATIEKLRAALEKYGLHKSYCNMRISATHRNCTCGLSQALTDAKL